MDIFLKSVFNFSTKSQKTQDTYQYWISRLLKYSNKQHPLDITPHDIQQFYLSFHEYALSTREIIRATLLYFFTVLCHDETPEVYHYQNRLAVKHMFAHKRKHAYTLPEITSRQKCLEFCDALPQTTIGQILREMYRTGHTFDRVLNDNPLQLSCSKQYAQQIAAKTARQVNIPQGFGLRGIRASGLCHRIQSRKDDMELVAIFKDSQLSFQQFRLYLKAAGELKT